MNLQNRTNSITETAIITLLMTVFLFVGLHIVPLVIILFPVPFIILGIRHDVKHSIISIIASSLLISILIDFFTGLFIFVIFGLFAIGLTYMINKGYSSYKVMIYGTAIFLLATAITLGILGYVTGINFIEAIDTSFSKSIDEQVKLFKEMDLSNYEISQMKNIIKRTVDYMIALIPATLIITSMFVTYINFWTTSSISRRLGYKKINIPKLKHFRLPNNIILGSAVIFLAIWIIRYFKLFYHETIFINVIILLIFLFYMQGLGVIVYLLDKKRFGRGVKIILIILSLLYVPIGLVIAFVGFLDSIFNFRKLNSFQ
ncbi:YybS family protein [Thermohalobacter berrensis]|uniref:DUF2232 domain-containing protein n=1 Tax=Thermohalobacter berrensis TaxID=99594 RepID=A0A419T3F8_9FIRM|nr:YybS family protein [Thermohalobacter berrensis]RKD32084.1 hypothetical protein BET03_11445 [Thermohalobacter berrensis]